MFDLPRGVLFPVETAELAVDDGPHPFEAGNAGAIAANWRAEITAKPALFDGKVVLFSSLTYRDGKLAGRCHTVSYSTFLYWRAQRGARIGEHVYAHAALVSADNRLVAVRMADHTANAGQVYFAAGSFDPDDFRGGHLDIEANMAREVSEETGLDLAAMRPEPLMHGYSIPSGTVLLRRFRADETADRLAERIAAHIAREGHSEITEPVLLGAGDEAHPALAGHMPAIVRWHFSPAG